MGSAAKKISSTLRIALWKCCERLPRIRFQVCSTAKSSLSPTDLFFEQLKDRTAHESGTFFAARRAAE